MRMFFASALLVVIGVPANAQSNLRIGVWNIEKLSATADRGFPELKGPKVLKPRTDEDLKAIAHYVRDKVKADALLVHKQANPSPFCWA